MLSKTLRRYRHVASLAIAAALTGASVAGAAPEPDPATASAEQWKGRFCTKPGCAASEAAPWGQAAGFGAAVVAAGLVARRRE